MMRPVFAVPTRIVAQVGFFAPENDCPSGKTPFGRWQASRRLKRISFTHLPCCTPASFPESLAPEARVLTLLRSV